MADERMRLSSGLFEDRFSVLLRAFNTAWREFCAHPEDDGLTELQRLAWVYEREALKMRLTAAKIRLDDEHARQFLRRQKVLL